jgi:hypothetical protein
MERLFLTQIVAFNSLRPISQRRYYDHTVDVLLVVGSDGKFYEGSAGGVELSKTQLPEGVKPLAAGR